MTLVHPTLLRWIWGEDRHMRIRLQQWTFTLCVYVFGFVVLHNMVRRGLLSLSHVHLWMAFNITGLVLLYVAIRSGWSRRLGDPSMTEPQMVFAVCNSLCCYAMAGEVRSAMLYPMMLAFMFGAFSLSWRRIAALTVFALACTATVMWLLHHWNPTGALHSVVDESNFLVMAIMLPGTSVVASTLGNLRRKVRKQRMELQEALNRIQQIASTDALTGLYNRRHAEDMVEREMHRVVRGGGAFAVALVDLDRFKRINDRHGHGAGDEVLRQFAAMARAEMRTVDVVSRWGGEEFLIILSECGATGSMVAMHRLAARVRQCRVKADGEDVSFTMSAGVALYRPGERLHDLIARADAALYRAKNAGRDRVVRDEGRVVVSSLEAMTDAGMYSI